jgi:hypothetical protein
MRVRELGYDDVRHVVMFASIRAGKTSSAPRP